jgi:adenylate cyclase
MATGALAQKERELQLLQALDAARDTLYETGDPQHMFEAIARLLQKRLQAEAAAILLVADSSDDAECIAAVGVPEDIAIHLCREAMTKEEIDAIKTGLWTHTIAVRIILDRNPLGGIFLGRHRRPFKDDEIALLKLAESQIDSAVMEARMIWKIAQRNRELEAIYQIDRMRDDITDESTLIGNFTTLLQDQFKSDLCMFIVSSPESGDMVVRAIVDKRELPTAALDAIREVTDDIRVPQIVPTPPGIQDMMLLAAPFIVGGVRMGAVVLGRKQPFNTADNRLLFAMVSQMDSAIVHSRVSAQLNQRNLELEAIYRIDQIRDRETDLEAMLQSVVTELCKTISCEVGYLMLYDEQREQPLQLKASTEEGLLTSPAYYEVISRWSREALFKATTVYSNQPEGEVRSILAIPLILNAKIIGVFGALNSSSPRGFSHEDRRMLTAITSQIDTAIFERLERRKLRKVMSRSVDPKVLEHLLQNTSDNVLTGERMVLSVIFADIRGSTEWAERTTPEELVMLLNTFLSRMTDVIFKHGGTLDKFVGDEVIALFGSPIPMPDHALRAARTALEMQQAHQALVNEFRKQEKELPLMGVGISSGEVIAGEFGPPIRTDYTAIGRVMNLGARLCSVAGGGQILISPSTYHTVRDQVEVNKKEPISLKGIGQPVPVFELLRIKE